MIDQMDWQGTLQYLEITEQGMREDIEEIGKINPHDQDLIELDMIRTKLFVLINALRDFLEVSIHLPGLLLSLQRKYSAQLLNRNSD